MNKKMIETLMFLAGAFAFTVLSVLFWIRADASDEALDIGALSEPTPTSTIAKTSETVSIDMEELLAIDPTTLSSLVTVCDPNEASEAFEKDQNFAALIKIWASDGTICEVLGHKWDPVPWLNAVTDPEVCEKQQCMVCQETRLRHLTDWE